MNVKRKRILFVSHGCGLYGSERSLINLLKGLDRQRYDPLVLLRGQKGLKEVLDEIGVETLVYPLAQWVPYAQQFSRWHFKESILQCGPRIRDVKSILREKEIDLVYTNSLFCIEAAVAAKQMGIPNIVHIREIIHREPLFRPYLPSGLVYGILNFLCQKIVVVSQAVKDALYMMPRRKIRVIYNAVDPVRFQSPDLEKKGRDFRQEHGISEDETLITLAGRYALSKGQGDLIEAAAVALRDFDRAKVLFVGSGDETLLKQWENRVRELGLADRVRFLGFQNDMTSVYAGTDICVCPSWVDPFPLTVLEAMSFGKPVVATRSGGAQESVDDGRTGLLVPPRDPQSLAAALLKVLKDDNLARRMGEAGKNKAGQLYTLPRYVREIEETIDQVLKDHKRSPR